MSVKHMYLSKLLLIAAILFFPLLGKAKVIISEVMYDLEGADSGREWIEIHNNGDKKVDINTWRFSEGGTNHKLNIVQKNGVLSPGDYAIIADNADKFFVDWASYSGILFDSSFSLSNSGEILILRDGDLNDVDVLNYSSEYGGAGDGNSIQLVSSEWTGSSPTPGEANNVVKSSQTTGSVEEKQEAEQTSGTSNSESADFSDESGENSSAMHTMTGKRIKAFIETSEQVVVGAQFEAWGSSYGFENEPLMNARYIWNFGDGVSKEGKNVLHTYNHPGKYAVVVSVASGEFSAGDKVIIEAVSADVEISTIETGDDGFIELNNPNMFDLDISGWRLVAMNTIFVIPPETLILAQQKVRFSSNITGLSVNTGVGTVLTYPSGKIATEYHYSEHNSFVSNIADKNKDRTENIRAPFENIPNSAVNGKIHTPVTHTSSLSLKRSKVVSIVDHNDAKEQKIDQDIQIKPAGNTVSFQEAGIIKSSKSGIAPWVMAVGAIVVLGIESTIIMRRQYSQSGGDDIYRIEGYEVTED